MREHVNWSPSWLVPSEAATIMVICSEPVSDPWGTHDSALRPLLTVSVSSSLLQQEDELKRKKVVHIAQEIMSSEKV